MFQFLNQKRNALYINVLLTSVIVFVFYGKTITNINTVLYSDQGDGLRGYYAAMYHIKFDKEYGKFEGMLYPYGDHVLFADIQPPISNTLKLINNFIPVADYTVGVINSAMLISILLGSLFLFLFFRRLNTPPFYGAIVSPLIVFHSPQLYRFFAHYSISYLFIIPATLYFIIRFYQDKTLKNSLLLGIYMLVMTTFHFYTFAMSGALILAFYFGNFLFDKNFRNFKFLSINISIQVILPYLIVQSWLFFSDIATDRTSTPWGFMTYISGWEGVFYPYNTYLSDALEHIIIPREVQGEGIAALGITGTVIFFYTFSIFSALAFYDDYSSAIWCVLALAVVIHLVFRKFKIPKFKLTDNRQLNIFGITAFLFLFLSYGMPFIFDMQWLIPYMGPLKQIRSLGRFNWLFYYIMNIIAFYVLIKLDINKYIKYSIITLAICITAFESNRILNVASGLNNKNEVFTDYKNELQINYWVNNIPENKYQAIIPLPYFLIGSENIWRYCKTSNEIMRDALIVSLKTGLPLSASAMGRTSITRTYKNLSLILEPYKALDEIRSEYPNEKPFLVIVRENDLVEDEKAILSLCTFLFKTENVSFYELDFNKLFNSKKEQYTTNLNYLKSLPAVPCGEFISTTDSTMNYFYNNYTDQKNEDGYVGAGRTGNVSDINFIYNAPIPNASLDTSQTYTVSYWMNNFDVDLMPRCVTQIFLTTKQEPQPYYILYNSPQAFVKVIDGSWALLEFTVKPKDPADVLQICIWSEELKNTDVKLYIDEFMIRPTTKTLYKTTENKLFMNGRFYQK